MLILAHDVSDSQTYHVGMNESEVSLGFRLNKVHISLPAEDSGYLDLFYGGSFEDSSVAAFGLYAPSPVQAQPPASFVTTASGNTRFLRYYLPGGLTRIDWGAEHFSFPPASDLSFTLTGSDGFIALFGELLAV